MINKLPKAQAKRDPKRRGKPTLGSQTSSQEDALDKS